MGEVKKTQGSQRAVQGEGRDGSGSSVHTLNEIGQQYGAQIVLVRQWR